MGAAVEHCATCGDLRAAHPAIGPNGHPFTTRRLMADLGPGDTYVRRDADGRPTTVTVLRQSPAPYVDPFGRKLRALVASAEGREGLVPYGPGGTVEAP